MSGIAGEIDVQGHGALEGQVSFYDYADINLPDADDLLSLGQNTIDRVSYWGGNFDGRGTIVQNATTTVERDTVIDVATYDFDGQHDNSITTIQQYTTLTINADYIEATLGQDSHDGIINVNGGALEVNRTLTIIDPITGEQRQRDFPWTLGGQLNLNRDGLVKGTGLVVDGSIDVDTQDARGSAISGPVRFRSAAQVSLFSSEDSLTLAGPTTFAGGSFTGSGTLWQDGDAIVTSDTAIDVSSYIWDGGTTESKTTIEPNATFTINADRITNQADDGYDGVARVQGGTLVVNQTSLISPPTAGLPPIEVTEPWRLDGELILSDNATVRGSPIDNHGRITGEGTIKTDDPLSGPVRNYGTVSPGNSPGTLTIDHAFSQQASGRLLIEIAGFDAGQYDMLEILGDASFDGSIELIFADRFAPEAGQTFELLTVTGQVSGEFAQVNIQNLLPGFEYQARFIDGDTFQLTALNDGQYIPEPITALLAIGGAIMVTRRRRPSR